MEEGQPVPSPMEGRKIPHGMAGGSRGGMSGQGSESGESSFDFFFFFLIKYLRTGLLSQPVWEHRLPIFFSDILQIPEMESGRCERNGEHIGWIFG